MKQDLILALSIVFAFAGLGMMFHSNDLASGLTIAQVGFCINPPPFVEDIPSMRAFPGHEFRFKIPISQSGNETYSFSDDSDLFNIDSSGIIKFVPASSDIGSYIEKINVTDHSNCDSMSTVVNIRLTIAESICGDGYCIAPESCSSCSDCCTSQSSGASSSSNQGYSSGHKSSQFTNNNDVKTSNPVDKAIIPKEAKNKGSLKNQLPSIIEEEDVSTQVLKLGDSEPEIVNNNLPSDPFHPPFTGGSIANLSSKGKSVLPVLIIFLLLVAVGLIIRMYLIMKSED